MKLTLVRFQLFFPACHSLKDKRRLLQGLKTRLRSRFNVSVAEVEFQETWQRSALAVAWVSVDGSGIDQTLDALTKMIEYRSEIQIVDALRSDF